MIAAQTGLGVGDFIWTGGDCHIYDTHLKHESGNSHMPMLYSYRKALAAYETVLQERMRTRNPLDAHRFDADALRAVITAVR